MLSNCGAGEDFESPLDSKEINKPVNPKGSQPWTFTGRTDAEAEASIPWPPHAKNYLNGKDWCWARQKAKGEGDDRGWDGQIASLTQWRWIWVNSRSWWWKGKCRVLQSMGSQRVGHDWVTELNWTTISKYSQWILQWWWLKIILHRFKVAGDPASYLGYR